MRRRKRRRRRRRRTWERNGQKKMCRKIMTCGWRKEWGRGRKIGERKEQEATRRTRQNVKKKDEKRR